MPVKNAAQYLNECLESIINQDFIEWRLIAINDHSTDSSEEILRKYEAADKRISVHKNTGQGIIDALSQAEELASHEFITRMDADDLMRPNKLSKLLELHDGSEMISTSYVQYFAAGGIGDGYAKYEQWLNSLIDANTHYQEVYKECVLPSPNWLMKRSTLQNLGGFKSLEYPEDYDLCFKAYSRNIPIKGVQEVLHDWRDYSERTSRNDDNYKDNAFLPLKVKYFKALDHNPTKKLALWGAGKKGKKIAQLLMESELEFDWITDNPKKLGVPIFGKSLIPRSAINNDNTQIILAVAGPEDQKDIQNFVDNHAAIETFWFC